MPLKNLNCLRIIIPLGITCLFYAFFAGEEARFNQIEHQRAAKTVRALLNR